MRTTAFGSTSLIFFSTTLASVEGNPGFGRLINELQRIVDGDKGLFCIMHDDVVLQTNTVRKLVEELFISNAAVVGP
ncbi:MAG: hypothetical protein ACKO93_06135, partial [Acidimicrobiaceae bacterium]